LPRFKSLSDESGSAVAEFVMLAVPLSLLIAASLNFCTNVYVDAVVRYQAVSAARFGALADVTLAEARSRTDSLCAFKYFDVRCELNWDAAGKWSKAEFSFQPLSVFLFQPRRVNINAAVAREALG
jgi:hypothetical protein